MNKNGDVTIDDETLKKLAFVSISSYRSKTVKSLNEGANMPSRIAKNSGIRTNHISKVLKELKKTGIVECINCDEVKKGRLYRLTDAG